MRDINEVYRKSGLGKWFHDESAGGKPGWDRYNSKGERVGECGDAKKGEPYAACLSKQKAARLGKEKIGNFVKRKRAAQSEAGRGKKGSGGKGKKPINVDTGINEQYKSVSQILGEAREVNEFIELLEKNAPKNKKAWSACKSQAKAKFDVYPSAYANAWAAKCYKKKGGKWRALKENEAPYVDSAQDIDSDPEEAKMFNQAAFKPEKLEDDLPVEKVLKNGNKFSNTKLRLEYFKNLINKAKELNEKI
jgi:hypothetical protein